MEIKSAKTAPLLLIITSPPRIRIKACKAGGAQFRPVLTDSLVEIFGLGKGDRIRPDRGREMIHIFIQGGQFIRDRDVDAVITRVFIGR